MEYSLKMYAVLTPESYLKKIYILSTIFCEDIKETAYAEIESLNAHTALIDVKKEDFKLLKKHDTIKQAIAFHNKHLNIINNGTK